MNTGIVFPPPLTPPLGAGLGVGGFHYLIDFLNYKKAVLPCVKTKTGLQDFVGYGQPLWLPHTGQAQGPPVHIVSTP